MRVLSMAIAALFLGVALVGTGFAQEQAQQDESEETEVIRGGPGDDLIIGTERRDILMGGTGADVVRGGGGADVIEGGPGSDQLEADSFEEMYNLNDGDD